MVYSAHRLQPQSSVLLQQSTSILTGMGRNSRLLYHKPDKNAIVTIAISNILRSQEISPLFHFTDGAPVEPCPAILKSLERGNAPHFLSGNDRTTASKEKLWFIHPQTKKELEALLRILNDHGEEKLLHYIKYRYLKGETRKIRY